jgi:cyclopropane-fatty-acyl-phospholipid synthase
MDLAPPDRRAEAAARLLQRVFASLPIPLTFRLWDGATVRTGAAGESTFAVALSSPRLLRTLLRDPTPLRFGEAFIAGELDIEGDLFAAMQVAIEVEKLRVPLRTRLAVLGSLLRR